MKKYLPKSFKNPAGFTLIELMIVVAIIAVLSVIGITIFGNIQVRGRDSRRVADIDAIAKAMEVAKADAVTYPALTTALFANGVIPNDPLGLTVRNYCYAASAVVASPANWTGTTCPVSFSSTPFAAGLTAWKVCVSLEVTTSSPNVVCRVNQQ